MYEVKTEVLSRNHLCLGKAIHISLALAIEQQTVCDSWYSRYLFARASL